MSNIQPHVAEKSATYKVLKDLERSERWPRVPLTEAVDLNPKPDRSSLSDELEVSFVPMAAVEAGTGAIDASIVRRYGDVKKGYTYFRDGDVLFAKITPCMENGKIAVARQLRNGIGFGSTEFHVLRPRKDVDAHYVYHFISSQRFRAEAAHRMTGAVGQKRVPAAFLEQSDIPLPPIDEQRRLVSEMEKQFSRLDKAVANLKRVSKNLKSYKSAVLTEATCVDRKTLPTGWRWSTIGELAEVGTGATPKRDRADYWRSGTVPWVASAAVNKAIVTEPTELITELALKETNCRVYPPGTLLVAMYGEGKTRGTCAQLGIAAATNQALAAIQSPAEIRPYLKLVLQASYLRTRRVASGGVQPNLNLSHVRAIRVPLPPIEDQRRIVEDVDRRLSVADDIAGQLRVYLKRAERYRLAFLIQAFCP